MGEFRVFRKIEHGEFFIVPGDTGQGGGDFNCVPFISYNKLDVPITYWNSDVASAMTPDIHLALEFLFDITGVPPVVGFERNNGGSSEMERLRVLNRLNKYVLYIMKHRGKVDGEEESNLLGWVTSATTRPYLTGDWKSQFDAHAFAFFDQDLLDHHKTFIKSRTGKPQASSGKHDDGVMALAIGNQMYQTERPTLPASPEKQAKAKEVAKNIMRQMKKFY